RRQGGATARLVAPAAVSVSPAASVLNPTYTVSAPTADGTVTVTPSTTQAPVVFTATSTPSNGFVTDNGDGTVRYRSWIWDQVAVATGRPTADSFTVQADDGNGTVESFVVTVPIKSISDPLGVGPPYPIATPADTGMVSGTAGVTL